MTCRDSHEQGRNPAELTQKGVETKSTQTGTTNQQTKHLVRASGKEILTTREPEVPGKTPLVQRYDNFIQSKS